jgi:Mg/Co/Ni transporter MgtE
MQVFLWTLDLERYDYLYYVRGAEASKHEKLTAFDKQPVEQILEQYTRLDKESRDTILSRINEGRTTPAADLMKRDSLAGLFDDHGKD